MERERCGCCGGLQPADPDAHDEYLRRPDDAYCTGALTVGAGGNVLGCGAWSAEAYRDTEVDLHRLYDARDAAIPHDHAAAIELDDQIRARLGLS